MDAVFKVSSSEFNRDLFNKIAGLLKGTDAEVTIAVKGKDVSLAKDEFWLNLDKSIAEIEQGKGITFTMEELEAYTKQ